MFYNAAEGDVVFSYISSVKLFVPPAYNLPYLYCGEMQR
jgi:hypothetical protein